VEPVAPSPQHALASVADGVVVVGASAGGVEALVAFVRALPADTRQAVCVVLHVSPAGTSAMPQILGRAARLPVHSPADGQALLGGHIYVAPPDYHLEIEPGRVRLTQSPRENGHRPAIDATMRSASLAYGSAVIGVVLSGSRDDGTAGLLAIKHGGGVAVVQDPAEALYEGMPANAIAHVAVDAVLPIGQMAGWLAMHRQPVPRPIGGGGVSNNPDTPQAGEAPNPAAAGTRFTCPDCGGVLFEQEEGGLTRFRCSIGHASRSRAWPTARLTRSRALWTAVRALEDRSEILRQLGARVEGTGNRRSAKAFSDQAEDALRRAGLVRAAIESARAVPGDEAEAAS
jgi:two-component system chemotaxis response regulator CheB